MCVYVCVCVCVCVCARGELAERERERERACLNSTSGQRTRDHVSKGDNHVTACTNDIPLYVILIFPFLLTGISDMTLFGGPRHQQAYVGESTQRHGQYCCLSYDLIICVIIRCQGTLGQ